MKTKTAYILNIETYGIKIKELDELISNGILKEIQIADDGEFLRRNKKVTFSQWAKTNPNMRCDNGDLLEPVIIEVKEPLQKITVDLNSMKVLDVETSDDYEWVLLKEGDEIREGDEMLTLSVGIGFQPAWKPCLGVDGKVPKALPYRRRVLKSEHQNNCQCDTKEWDLLREDEWDLLREDRDALQKKVEELVKELDLWKRLPMNEGRVIRESIEGLKETIESQNLTMSKREKEFDELLESKAELRREIENLLREIQCGLSANKELREEIEELKKQVPKWVKNDNARGYKVPYIKNFENGLYAVWFNGRSLKIEEAQTTTIDPAEKAWEKSDLKNIFYDTPEDKEKFKKQWIAGFKAAMIQREGE